MNEACEDRPKELPTAHAFLLRAAELLHRYGTPSYRLERVMTKVSTNLGIASQYLYTPTSLVVSIGSQSEEQTFLRRIDSGDVDVSKLLAFDAILEKLSRHELTIEQAREALDEAALAPPPFSLATTVVAAGTACGCVAVLFGGGWVETTCAIVFGWLLTVLGIFHARFGSERGIFEPVSGFLVAVTSLLMAQYVLPMDDRLTTLAALILPLPGLSLTVALTELAMGHLAAGSARLAGAMVTLLTLVLGVAIAWRIVPGGMHLSELHPYVVSYGFPKWAIWCTLPIAPAAFGVLFRVPMSQWPVIYSVSLSGFLASYSMGQRYSVEVGAFCGALAVGVGSNLYARLTNRPAMAMQTPGMLILVPGSVGYRSLTAMLHQHTEQGIELAFTMVLVGVSLVGGFLFANLLLPPRRIL